MPVPNKTEAINRLSAKERIYQTLRDWIIEGVLTPNEKLMDAELCEYFSVSRTPVREAFQLLEAQRLVEIQPGKATIVTAVDLKNLREWYMPLAYIQGLAAELACNRVTDRQIKELERLNDIFADAIHGGKIKSILEADGTFHRKILEMAKNQYLTDFSETLFLHIQRIEHAYFRWTSESDQSVETHKALIEAIKSQDSQTAGERMKSNWLQTMALYEEKLLTGNSRP